MLTKLFTALFLSAVVAYPSINFGQPEQFVETQDFAPRVIIQTELIQQRQQPFSLDIVKSETGRKILRDEAVLITEIQKKLQRGRDTERNLTAVRDVIRKKMDEDSTGSRRLGGLRRRRLETRLGRLDQLIVQLQSSNRDGEARFREFIGGVASGKIRNPNEAHSILDSLYRTLESGLMKLVKVCYSFLSGIIDTIHNLALGLGNAIHNILGLKLG
ncbi:uncharacterized protein LOC144157968 [Haemaphysalis longicornis]